MFFVSTPTIVIYVVLAIFYLANMAFFAVNRQHETVAINKVANANLRSYPQHTIVVYGKAHAVNRKLQTETFYAWQFSDKRPLAYDSFRGVIPDSLHFKPEQGFYHELFSRPPPVV